jgi:type I restriction enzyme M protein
MLDNITKKNIDNCRDVLVGKVPDPKSQIEQITLALIYKFMDDMDKESIDLGGMPKFFTGDYEKFGWRKLFDPSLGGKEVLDLYSEALDVLQTNANLPELFRNIFKNAYLPYRDPSTLKMFLKYINEFEYSHSEKLGDAFEYLLSVMGSQGDAGQFRTPRHVIDFIAACLNPQKHETVADPACGTAGFLLSAYKHILQNNTDKRLGDKLTPDDRKKLAENFYGYDISPDMVRLSLVNMYLHGFTTPKIFEYDTLSSEDRWNETFDVILANPPFMTPKGGIRPHKKFGVQANKAEVLFTDYIAEHLSKNGRAGIVVPNGIVATTQTAYKQLRKMLVDDSLIAVVSLPAGCFNPYSGVKTSILMLDKPLAKKTNHVLFIKVSNDGYDLGAQRREHDKNDLPLALEAFNAYKESFSSGKPFDTEKYSSICTLVEKEKIATNKDIVLSGERYVEGKVSKTEFELVKIGNFFDIFNGFAFDSNNISNSINSDSVPIIKIGNVIHGEDVILNKEFVSKSLHKDKKGAIFNGKYHDIFIALSGATTGKISKLSNEYIEKEYALNQRVAMLRSKSENALSKYLYYILLYGGIYEVLLNLAHGAAQPNLSSKQISELEIPLPPIEIQEQIVKEIEGYQKIIDGAKMVVDNYKPTISINPDWEMVELGEVCDINSKASEPTKLFGNELFTYIDIESVENGTGILSFNKVLNPKEAPSRARRVVKIGDVALSTVRPNLRAFAYLENLPENCLASTGFAILSANNKSLGKYLYYSVHQDYMVEQMISKSDKGQYPSVTASDVKELEIYLPTIEEQKSIVQNLEEEQQLVASNKQLIYIFEQKIKDKINQVWGVKEDA